MLVFNGAEISYCRFTLTLACGGTKQIQQNRPSRPKESISTSLCPTDPRLISSAPSQVAVTSEETLTGPGSLISPPVPFAPLIVPLSAPGNIKSGWTSLTFIVESSETGTWSIILTFRLSPLIPEAEALALWTVIRCV